MPFANPAINIEVKSRWIAVISDSIGRLRPSVTWFLRIFTACLLSVLLTSIFWPGILDGDAGFRWGTAFFLAGRIESLPGLSEWTATTWYPPLDPLLKAIVWRVFSTPVAYTALQSFFFLFAWLAVLGRVWPGLKGLVLSVLILLFPPIFLISVFVSSHVLAACCLLGLVFAFDFLKKARLDSKSRLAWLFVAIVVCGTILLGVRYNAIAIAPVVLALAFLACRQAAALVVASVAMGLAILVNVILPNTLPVKKVPVLTATVAWEHAGMLKILQAEGDTEAVRRFPLEPYGDTGEAIRLHRDEQHASVVFGDGDGPPALPREKLFASADEVYRRFLSLAWARPWAFARNRLAFYKVAVGATDSDWFLPILWDVDGSVGGCFLGIPSGRAPESLSYKILLWNAHLMRRPAITFLFRPWVVCGIGLLLALLLRLRGRSDDLGTVAFLLGGAYYGSYFLISPGVIFGYFYPTFALWTVAILSFSKALLFSPTHVR